jgi:hypothetical protein
MSLNSPDAYLNVNNANLRVFGNVHTNQVHLGNMTVRPSYGLSTVTDVSNTTPDTIQFTNTHTAFTTTGNVTVGKGLTVAGNVEVGTANLFVDTVNSRIGVGTTEPSGQLELVGDSTIQEYPPGPMDNYENHFDGHGVFYASWSSNANDIIWHGWRAFDGVPTGTTNLWHSDGGYSTSGTYAATGSRSLGGYQGDWLRLDMPYKIKLTSFKLRGRDGFSTQSPKSFVIIGSNTGNEWDVVFTTGDAALVDTISKNFTVNSTNYYKYYALVVGSIAGSYGSVGVSEWRLFGTPGPTTIDKGSLTLGRTLDVPRISRYDVDTETPRPEKLVVDFDTTVNSTPTDISGQGNHGKFVNGAYYSSADKAFVFDGTDDYIQTTSLGFDGDQVHSVSLWFWSDVEQSTFGGNEHALYGTGGLLSTPAETGISLFGTYALVWRAAGGTQYPMTFNANQWNHLCMTYSSGGSVNSRLWLNGVELAQNSSVTSTSAYSFQTGEYLILGTWINNDTVDTNYTWDGQISNFKLYSVALEPSEVQKLYRLGRTRRSMVISDTAVGIGKAPEAQLDVRGSAIFGGTLDVHGTGIHVNGTVLREYSSIGAVTVGTWYKVCDFRDLPASRGGVCVIRIHWGGGASPNGGTQYWSGYASGIVVYNTYNDGSGIYTSAPLEPLTLTQQYHHRVADAFEFGLDGDGSNGSYGYQSLYIKSPVSLSSLGLQVNAIPLRR